MSHDAASAPAPAADHSVAAVNNHASIDAGHHEHHHHHHHHYYHHSGVDGSASAPQPAWSSLAPAQTKSSRDSRKKGRATPPPPYTDDPSAPADYMFADAAAAESQRAVRPCILRDALVVLFQLVFLVLMGLIAYNCYLDFGAAWRRSHAHEIAAEVERRAQLLSARAVAADTS